jgi:hypothetical protein
MKYERWNQVGCIDDMIKDGKTTLLQAGDVVFRIAFLVRANLRNSKNVLSQASLLDYTK